MEILRAIVDSFLQLAATTWTQFGTDPTFREGFLMGVFWTSLVLALLGLFRVLAYLRALVSRFFRPVTRPGDMPTRQGPSPFSMMLYAIFGIIGFTIFISVFVMFLMSAFASA